MIKLLNIGVIQGKKTYVNIHLHCSIDKKSKTHDKWILNYWNYLNFTGIDLWNLITSGYHILVKQVSSHTKKYKLICINS